ncbi:MAG TPA: hypothetical protein VK666_27055 [Chryseolinea sp.]|nr:hypothetical protein [Chryseolinea sp.]
MKHFLFILLVFAAITSKAQQHQLEKVWETDSIVAIPESVLPDTKNNILFVSLIDGEGWTADGKGGVGKLSPDGKKYDSTWIRGLNAPKGLGMIGNRLYVADISEVVVIDIAKGVVEKKIQIDSATGLNDITVDSRGIVYVSDSRRGKIWQIQNDIPSLYLDNVKGVNGLKAIDDYLLIGAGKDFIRAGKDKTTTKITSLPEGIDGIEPVGNGDYILTAWSGYIFFVGADGHIEPLLDTHLEKKNTADIGYDAAKKILYVPTFNAKKVVAYRLAVKS